MEEHTIELIDYLRVLWWGKWIALGCMVGVIGMGVALVYLPPTSYRASLEITLTEYLTVALHDVAGTETAFHEAVSAAMEEVERAIPSITATSSGSTILLSIADGTSEEQARTTLERGERTLQEELSTALVTELEYLETGMMHQESMLAEQLGIVRQKLSDERVSGDFSVAEALAEGISLLEVNLAGIQAQLGSLASADPQDLLSLRSISDPVIASSRVGARTALPLVGFLGLIVSVLLTFFVHYLIQVRDTERNESKSR